MRHPHPTAAGRLLAAGLGMLGLTLGAGAAFTCEHCAPASHEAAAMTAALVSVTVRPSERDVVESALHAAQQRLDAILAVPDRERTFDNTVRALDDLLAHLELDTNFTMFMAYVSTDADERDRGQDAERTVTAWLIDLGQNEDLYRAVKSYADRGETLDPVDQRLLDHIMRDFRRAGMMLSASDRARLAELQKEISELQIEFNANIREDDSRVPLLRSELWGMSDEFIAGLEESNGVYLVGLSYTQFLPVMDQCESEATRQKLWIAYKRRGGQANVRALEEILERRAEAADLLGYDHPADYEIEVRMAKEAENVLAFYERLRPMVREKAKRDYAELVAAKRAHVDDPDATLHPWDTNFYEKKLMREKYAVDSEKVREYFPMEAVTEGLFSITQSLYGLEYRNVTDRAASKGVPLWHEDVELYEVWDKAASSLLGMFAVDLHPRANKYSHAAQWGLAQHKVWADGSVNLPFAALVCNFTKPTADKPSLMSHDEVETYFHEFGHCLHTILSDSKHWRFAGTGVERDFVEAPSQMFENWVWDGDVLRTFARHYKTGEAFPDALLDGMLKARNLGSGMKAERQFFYGLYDMSLHVDPEGDVDTTELAHRLWAEDGENVELYDPVPNTWFQAAFGHLMHYNAGYYGYQWSLVYACDMFQRFKELGMLDPAAGRYYREKILAAGGTQDGLDLVRGYLGREPDMSAYLRHLGLDEE